MSQALLSLSVLLCSAAQDALPPWRTDVTTARESAVRDGRPCVLLLYFDSL
jgi:hypothetical protein